MDHAPNDRSTDRERRDGAHDEPVDQREERAVDAVTSERLSRGVRQDAHGEYAPDPYPDDEDPGETTQDVIDLHRREAARIEHQPDVPRADD